MALGEVLSKVVVGFTIEMDNLHEARMAETWARPFKTSFTMWANLLRYVAPSGTRLDDLIRQSCVGKAVTVSTVGAMERWGYVAVGGDPGEGFVSPRAGFGTARGLKPDTVVFPKQAGTLAAERWAPLPAEVEQQWRARFGDARVDGLRSALAAMPGSHDLALPRFLPVVSSRGLFSRPSLGEGSGEDDEELPALLARTLLTLTLQQEDGAAVSCAIGENVLRVIGEDGIAVSAVPSTAGVAKEAVAVSLTWLQREGFVDVGPSPAGRGKHVSLTAAGREVQAEAGRRRADVGAEAEALHAALDALLDDPAFGAGLRPPAMGWRAGGRYAQLTEGFVTDPRAHLPNHPMVLHRGGWPDGS